ncbi:hypothetical protein OEA41_010785 [Lepraria neglecta]|uniref:Nudix hydrolase domain-containing protein n=1 Tax=Lepraria neglecta TaxID=209136 RepID=A0AAD9YZK9_9LECA|nr:hypothetical protein OEA41_010785 [Lepraria neglecta]
MSPSGLCYNKLIVGAIIFHPTSTPTKLLLKHAAHETAFLNVFEIPDSRVDDTDATILHSLKREVREETGMEVETVTAAVESFSYAVEKSVWAGDERMVLREMSLQLNFGCEVAGGEFCVNP